MKIIIVVGLVRSGKDTVSEYISRAYGYQLLVASDVIREEAKKRGITPSKENLTKLTEELYENGFQGEIARRLMERFSSDRVVINGFRSPVQIDFLRNEYNGDVYVLEVFSRSDLRFARRENDDPQNEEKLFERDKIDIEKFALNKVLEMADYRVNNNGSKEELYKQIDEFMKEIE